MKTLPRSYTAASLVVVSVLFMPCSPAGEIGLREVLVINQAHKDSMQDGWLKLEIDEYKYQDGDSIARDLDEQRVVIEEHIEHVSALEGLSEADKQINIEVQRARLSALRASPTGAKATQESYKENFYFGMSRASFRTDIEPETVEEESSGVVGATVLPKRVIRTVQKGIEVRYYPTIDQAVLQRHEGTTPQELSCYAGILDPAKLQEFTNYDEVEASRSQIDGNVVVEYVLRDDASGFELYLYLDPDVGYRLRRADFLDGGYLTRQIEASGYTTVDGVPFPTVYEEVDYMDDKSGEIATKLTKRLIDAGFGDPVDDEIFHLDFPEGTTIVDLNLKMSYTVGTNEPMDMESLSNSFFERKKELEVESLAAGIASLHDDGTKGVQRTQLGEEQSRGGRGYLEYIPVEGGLVRATIVLIGLAALLALFARNYISKRGG